MSSSVQTDNPVLTFEGKRYDLNTLPNELKELVRGMQVADAQLRMHEDTLNGLMALPNLVALSCFPEPCSNSPRPTASATEQNDEP